MKKWRGLKQGYPHKKVQFFLVPLKRVGPKMQEKEKREWDLERGWRREVSKWSFQPQSMRKLKPSMETKYERGFSLYTPHSGVTCTDVPIETLTHSRVSNQKGVYGESERERENANNGFLRAEKRKKFKISFLFFFKLKFKMGWININKKYIKYYKKT